jgi:HK97 family phage major capsid protein
MNTHALQRAEELASQGKAILDRSELEGRGRTPDEDFEVARVIRQLKELRAGAAIDEMGRQIGVEGSTLNDPVGLGRAPGDVFTQSPGYKRIADPASRASNWSSGRVEVPYRAKATLLEGELGDPGTGGALVQSDVRPGVVPTLFQPPTAVDLFESAPTSSNKVRVIIESVATSGAAVVPEAGEKPPSELEFDEIDEKVVKIATLITVSDELLSDAPALASYLNSRLSLFIRVKEEEEILHGAGGDNLLGLEPRIPAENKFVTSDADTPNSADHIYEAISVAERSHLPSDGVIVHPDDWAALRLLKDEDKNYIGGSPFSNTGSNPTESLWRRRVVVTTSCIPGTAVVGSFGLGATIFRRGGLVVEASNSHAELFASDETAIRAEVRLALNVVRPSSFSIADLGYAS